MTHDIVRDQGIARSPITLSDDDSIETLQFQEDSGSVDGWGGGVVILQGLGALDDQLDSIRFALFAAVIAILGVGS